MSLFNFLFDFSQSFHLLMKSFKRITPNLCYFSTAIHFDKRCICAGLILIQCIHINVFSIVKKYFFLCNNLNIVNILHWIEVDPVQMCLFVKLYSSVERGETGLYCTKYGWMTIASNLLKMMTRKWKKAHQN